MFPDHVVFSSISGMVNPGSTNSGKTMAARRGENIEGEYVKLARIALSGRSQDVKIVIHRTAKRYRSLAPQLAEELTTLAEMYGVSSNWILGEDDEDSSLAADRVKLAARELGKLREEDLDRVLQLIQALRASKGTLE